MLMLLTFKPDGDDAHGQRGHEGEHSDEAGLAEAESPGTKFWLLL